MRDEQRRPCADLGDSQLSIQWCAGDESAANALFARYAGALRAYFRKRLMRATDDLVQETLLAVLEARSRIKRPDAFRAYVFAVARLQVMVYLRRTNRDQTLCAGHGLIDEICPTSAESDREAESTESLLHALDELEAPFREIVHLTYWEGLSAPQISKALGVPVGTVYSRLQRARRKLQAARR